MSKKIDIDILQMELEGRLPNWLTHDGKNMRRLREIVDKNREKDRAKKESDADK